MSYIICHENKFDNGIEKYNTLMIMIGSVNDYDEIDRLNIIIEDIIKNEEKKPKANKKVLTCMNLVNRDFKKIRKMTNFEKDNFSDIFEDFLDSASILIEKYSEANEMKLNILQNKVCHEFGDFSFVHLYCTKLKLGALCESKKPGGIEKEIITDFNNFKLSKWKDTFELDFFYDLLASNSEHLNQPDKMVLFSKESIKEKECRMNENDPSFLISQRYIVGGYFLQNKYEEAYKEYKKINRKNLLENDIYKSKIQAGILKYSNKLLLKLNFVSQAIEDKTRLVEKLAQFKKPNDKELLNEIYELRSLMAKKNMWNEIRWLEKKYNLSPEFFSK